MPLAWRRRRGLLVQCAQLPAGRIDQQCVHRPLRHTLYFSDAADLEDEVIAQRTPYSRSNVLPGVARKTVIEIAQQQNIPVIVGPLTIDDLLSADECFVTNSIMEVMPVCRVERKALGKELPGDLTRRMGVLYRACVESYVRGDIGSKPTSPSRL